MRHSLAETLDEVVAYLDPRVATRLVLSPIRVMLGRLPAELSDWIYLEFRLWPREARVDLIIRVDRLHRDVLVSDGPDCRIPAALMGEPTWKRIRAFARTWMDARTTWDEQIDCLWLEFDLDWSRRRAATSLRTPRLFLDVSPTARREGTPASWWALACAASGWLGGPRPSPEVAGQLRRCLDTLPPGASLLSLGMPQDDTGRVLRASLIGISDDDLPTFLQALGWDGNALSLSRLLERLRRGLGRPRSLGIVNLDLGATIRDRVGLEFPFARKPQLRGVLAEEEFLADLVTLGLAEPLAIAGLRAWPGCSVGRLPNACWPSVTVRRLNHVKLVFEADRVAASKAYACFYRRLCWRESAGLISALPGTKTGL